MKVALVTEGTYPVHAGGVAAWCDQLVRGLPEVRFEVVALSGSGREPARLPPPGNVAAVHRVGLWAPVPRGRPFTGRRHRAVHRVRTRRCSSRVARRAEGRGVVRDVAAHPARAVQERVADRGPAQPARRGGAARRVVTHPRAGCARRRPMTLADALAVTDLVEHYLRPLQLTPPKAQLVHATANGPSMLVGLTAKWAAGHAGTALRARRLPARTAPRGPARRLPADGARRCSSGSSTGCASWATAAPTPCCRSATSTGGGRCAAARRPDRVRTLHNGVDPRRAARCCRTSRPCRPSSSPGGSTRSRTSTPSSAPSRWSASRSPHARLQLFGGVPAGNEGYAAEIRQLVADLRPRGLRHVRGAGVAGVAGVRGRARRRAVQPVGGAAAHGHRGGDGGPPHGGDRRRRDARGGGPRRGGRAARRPGRLRRGLRRVC